MPSAGAQPIRRLTVAALTGLLLTATPGFGQESSGESAPFLGGAERGGALVTQPVRVPGATVWEVQTDGPVRSSPVVEGGTVYVGSHDGGLYAIRLADGVVSWRFDVGEPVTAAPVVANDLVIVSDRNGSLYAVGRHDGALRWSDRAGTPLDWPWGLEGWDYIGSTPAFANGMVYAGSSDGLIRALDAATGIRRWAVQTGGRVRSSPAVSQGTVFVGSADGIVRALDGDSGSELWRFRTHGADLTSADFGFDRRTITGGPAVDRDEVYLGSRDARVYALDRTSGALIWENDDGGASAWVISTPGLTDRLAIFGRSSSAKVQAVDRATGEVVWDTRLGGLVFASPAIVDGLAYLTDGAGSLVALDTEDGEVVWSRSLGAPSWSSPTVAGGMVLVGADDGIVRAIGGAAAPGPRLAVFFDTVTATPSLSNGRGEAARITETLRADGFELLTSATITAWLEERLGDDTRSAVVLATDVLPEAVTADGGPDNLLTDYIRGGGRVVWTSVPPLWLRFDADGNADVDMAGPARFLGVDFATWVSDSRMHRPSPAGRAWGLEGWWTGTGGIDPAQVDIVLVTDEEGGASGWVKSFGGPAGSGWVHFPYAASDVWMEGLRRVTRYNLAPID